jgi:hypothetical protein
LFQIDVSDPSAPSLTATASIGFKGVPPDQEGAAVQAVDSGAIVSLSSFLFCAGDASGAFGGMCNSLGQSKLEPLLLAAGGDKICYGVEGASFGVACADIGNCSPLSFSEDQLPGLPGYELEGLTRFGEGYAGLVLRYEDSPMQWGVLDGSDGGGPNLPFLSLSEPRSARATIRAAGDHVVVNTEDFRIYLVGRQNKELTLERMWSHDGPVLSAAANPSWTYVLWGRAVGAFARSAPTGASPSHRLELETEGADRGVVRVVGDTVFALLGRELKLLSVEADGSLVLLEEMELPSETGEFVLPEEYGGEVFPVRPGWDRLVVAEGAVFVAGGAFGDHVLRVQVDLEGSPRMTPAGQFDAPAFESTCLLPESFRQNPSVLGQLLPVVCDGVLALVDFDHPEVPAATYELEVEGLDHGSVTSMAGNAERLFVALEKQADCDGQDRYWQQILEVGASAEGKLVQLARVGLFSKPVSWRDPHLDVEAGRLVLVAACPDSDAGACIYQVDVEQAGAMKLLSVAPADAGYDPGSGHFLWGTSGYFQVVDGRVVEISHCRDGVGSAELAP